MSTCTQVTELLISWMVCIGPTEKVIFNKSLEREKKKKLGEEEAKQGLGGNTPDQGNSQNKGPGAEVCLVGTEGRISWPERGLMWLHSSWHLLALLKVRA